MPFWNQSCHQHYYSMTHIDFRGKSYCLSHLLIQIDCLHIFSQVNNKGLYWSNTILSEKT